MTISTKHLTSAGWKQIQKDSKGAVADNGLQRALEKYEGRPADKLAERMADLKQVFKLALALNNTKRKVAYAPAGEYLAKVCEAAVKMQELLDADRKAAAVSDAEKLVLRGMIVQTATNVSTNAKANAALFGQQVEAACSALQAYARPKLKAMNGGMSAAEFLGPLVGVVAGQITTALVITVTNELGKAVVREMAKQAEAQLRKGVGGVSRTSDDLEHALDQLTLGAHDAALAISNVVANRVIGTCSKVAVEVNSGKRLSDSLTDFIEPFVQQNPTAIDRLLESRFGLPSPARSKDTYARIYRELVEKFEVAHIKATTPNGERMRWVVTGVPPELKRNAAARAEAATRDRVRDMERAEPGR